MNEIIYYTTHGIDSHKVLETTEKPLVLGGVTYENVNFCLSANSDGDVILHALTNAVSNATCVNILGKPADDMCKAISKITGVNPRFIGIHATTGEKLTSFGRGEGIYVSAMISWSEEIVTTTE